MELFSGIISELGIVKSISPQGSKGIRLAIQFKSTQNLVIGASVSIDGVCLTVVTSEPDHVEFDAIPETLSKTTLGSLKANHLVHIERALKVGDEIGGHLVSGHVHGVGKVCGIAENPFVLSVEVPEIMSRYIFEKGFISLSGASLTVVSVLDKVFTVALIPETLRVTKFSHCKVGDHLNIEVDQTTKAMVDCLESSLEAILRRKKVLSN
jgi:riboflavin synthase